MMTTASRSTRQPGTRIALLLSLLFLHLASSAPTPQVTGLANNGDSNYGLDDGNDASYLRYGDERRNPMHDESNQHSNPPTARQLDDGLKTQHPTVIHIIDDSNTNNPQPALPRYVEEEKDEDQWVFNIVIKKQRKQRSAFIAPDVGWLRDLVPRVVDVIDHSEKRIKEAVFSAMEDQESDRQIYVNVVKSSVLSEDEVPQILDRLKDLMWTGGPGVDQLRAESRQDDLPRLLVVNIIIFNVIAEEPSATFRDSYLEALEESNKVKFDAHMRQQQNQQPSSSHHHHHEAHDGHHESEVVHSSNSHHHHPNPSSSHHHPNPSTHHPSPSRLPATASEPDYHRDPPSSPSYGYKPPSQSYEVPVEDYFARRPVQTAMEMDYLRPEKSGYEYAEKEPSPPVPMSPYDDSLPVPASIFFTTLMEQQNQDRPEVEAVEAEPDPPAAPAETPSPTVAVAASTAASGNRNRFRTFGFVAVPLVAGLAGTMSMWLPAMAALGKRKRRSIISSSPSLRDRTDEAKAIDAKYMALLMGQRYANATRESLQEAIDNWQYRDQLLAGRNPSTNSGVFSTLRPLRFTRPGVIVNTNDQSWSREEDSPVSSTVKRSTDGVTEASSGSTPADDDVAEERLINGLPSTQSASESTYHVLPVSSSEDFDIVANFVKSTLSKMIDDDGQLLDNDVFVINSGSRVNGTSTMLIRPDVDTGSIQGTSATASASGAFPSTLNIFTADPVRPTVNSNESVTNSPVTYVSLQHPLFANNRPTTTTRSSSYSPLELTTPSTTSLSGNNPFQQQDEFYYFNDESHVEFYDEETGSTYTAQEVPIPTVPYSEPYKKTTIEPVPDEMFVNPYEVPQMLLNQQRNKTYPYRPTTSRPASIVTIQNYIQTQQQSLPDDVEVSYGAPPASSNVFTTLKFTHGGIPTTPPLQDFSTASGESSLVSDVVTNQMILANLLKDTTPPSSIIPIGSTTSPRPSTTRPIQYPWASQTQPWDFETTKNTYYQQMMSSSGINNDMYSPTSSAVLSDDVDLSGLIDQLSANLTTGLVTSVPNTNGIHFVNTSTELVFFSPFDDVTPSAIIDLDPDTQFADFNRPPVRPPIEAVEVETADDNGVVAPAVPLAVGDIAPVANTFGLTFGSVSVNSVGSSDNGGSSSSVSVSSGTTSSTTSSVSSGVVLGAFAVAAAAVTYLAAAFLPIAIPLVAKKRRTYAPAKKKHSSFAEPPANYNELGYTESEALYGPPATVYLKAKRRRRAPSRLLDQVVESVKSLAPLSSDDGKMTNNNSAGSVSNNPSSSPPVFYNLLSSRNRPPTYIFPSSFNVPLRVEPVVAPSDDVVQQQQQSRQAVEDEEDYEDYVYNDDVSVGSTSSSTTRTTTTTTRRPSPTTTSPRTLPTRTTTVQLPTSSRTTPRVAPVTISSATPSTSLVRLTPNTTTSTSFVRTSTAPATSSSTTTTTTTTVKAEPKTVAATTTTTTTTTITPFPTPSTPEPPLPNVGFFNGLARIGGAGIGIGLTSAFYAAAALWLPFIGKRKKRSVQLNDDDPDDAILVNEWANNSPAWIDK